jgi:cell division protein YceG involved in septum cleavage
VKFLKKESSFSDKKAVKRIFGTIFVMALTAAFLACILISVANDIYAFIKSEGEIILTVSSPLGVNDFSKLLHDNKVISNPHIFSLYIRSKNRSEVIEGFVGEAKLDRSMSYREILLALQNAQ